MNCQTVSSYFEARLFLLSFYVKSFVRNCFVCKDINRPIRTSFCPVWEMTSDSAQYEKWRMALLGAINHLRCLSQTLGERWNRLKSSSQQQPAPQNRFSAQDLVLFSHQKCRFGAGAAAEQRRVSWRPSSLVLIANVHISGDPINFMSAPSFVRDVARTGANCSSNWEQLQNTAAC